MFAMKLNLSIVLSPYFLKSVQGQIQPDVLSICLHEWGMQDYINLLPGPMGHGALGRRGPEERVKSYQKRRQF